MLYRGEDVHWSESALCGQTDAEVFFPDKGGSTKMAKKICDMCEVRVQCLEEALIYPISEQRGIAGGLDAKARKAILRAAAA